LRVLVLVVVVGIALGALIHYSPNFFYREEPAPVHPRLHMGGTATVFVVVENRWKGKYLADKGVEVSYESTGSSAGVDHLLEGSWSVACTHSPLSARQRQKAKEKGKDVIQVPLLLFGVAPVYNVKELKGKPPLKLTGEILADIYLGKIKEWNNPALKEINQGVELPSTPINVVHRQGPSGTTELFTEYLADVSEAWRTKVGKPASDVQWPVGLEAPRNLDMARLVFKTEGAIGYVDRMYTNFAEMDLDYAAMQNKDRTAFLRAEPENMTAAVASVLGNIPDDLGFNGANKPGKAAYPITGVVYALYCANQPEHRQQVVDFLRWATHQGQPYAPKLTFASIPSELVERIDRKLDAIKATP
jgi:phosphate transport system substrate-binding protein